jgi:hypothetical protein
MKQILLNDTRNLWDQAAASASGRRPQDRLSRYDSGIRNNSEKSSVGPFRLPVKSAITEASSRHRSRATATGRPPQLGILRRELVSGPHGRPSKAGPRFPRT